MAATFICKRQAFLYFEKEEEIIFSLTVEGSQFPRVKCWWHRPLHREAFVILRLLICQLSARLKGTLATMFSSAPFPSWWPKSP